MLERPHMLKPDRDWIKGRLVDGGRTQTDLGKHLGLDKGQISRLISGERRVQLDEVEPMAKYLGVSTIVMLRHLGLDV